MPAVKDISSIAEKWSVVTPQRAEQYRIGVTNPLKNWQAETIAANNAWELGIQQAISQKRFQKGVSSTGNDVWQKNAIEKGTMRFGPGVSAGREAYERGVGPYIDVIKSTTLPPKGPKGAPQNMERSAKMSAALHARKVGTASGGR